MWSPARTRRRWRHEIVIGLVGPNDVKTLQTKVHDYRSALQVSVDAMATAGNPLPHDQSQFSIQAWGDLVGRCQQFEDEGTSTLNPLAYLLAGSQYDRGRELLTDLDSWRDHLAAQKAPSVPAPIPVPGSDLGIAGGLGFALAAIVAILLLHELK